MIGSARRLRGNGTSLDRPIDRGKGKNQRYFGRGRSKRVADRARGHADRTEQIDLIAVMVTRRLAAIGQTNCRSLRGRLMPESSRVDRMDVTERQAKVDGERDKRQPGTSPDMITKPAHGGVETAPFRACLETQFSRSSEGVNSYAIGTEGESGAMHEVVINR